MFSCLFRKPSGQKRGIIVGLRFPRRRRKWDPDFKWKDLPRLQGGTSPSEMKIKKVRRGVVSLVVNSGLKVRNKY